MLYSLDLETLLLFLEQRRQNGKLSANLKRFPNIAHKGSCHVAITLIGGKVTSCVVQDDDGRVVAHGDVALRGLERMGQLDWAWSATGQTASAPVPVQSTFFDGSSLIPRRAVAIHMIDRSRLPRKHWQVLLLIDGSRTVAHIVSLLTNAPSPSDVREIIDILNDLQQQGLITVAGN